MSSKKLARIMVDYLELFNRVPKDQLIHLLKVQELARSYVEKVNSLPEGLPPINWEYYKNNVRKEYLPMVEEYEKKYAEFKVPYPEDIYKEELELMTKEVEDDIKEYKRKSQVRIAYYECMSCRLMETLPFDQMTLEDFCYAFPDDAPDFINRPTFWPHTPEEQLQPPKAEEILPEYSKEDMAPPPGGILAKLEGEDIGAEKERKKKK